MVLLLIGFLFGTLISPLISFICRMGSSVTEWFCSYCNKKRALNDIEAAKQAAELGAEGGFSQAIGFAIPDEEDDYDDE